jgi:hypothetical protein
MLNTLGPAPLSAGVGRLEDGTAMSKGFRMIATSLLVVLLLCVACLGLATSEPSYRWRSLSEWVDINYQCHLAGPTRRLQEEDQDRAEEAIRHIGTNALPTLLKMADHRTSALRPAVVWLSQRGIPAWRLFPSSAWLDEDSVHLSAYTAFRVLGPAAKPAAPALTALLHSGDTNVQDYAAAILGAIEDKSDTNAAKQIGLSQ